MRNEYALNGVGYFKHWSDAYPTMAIARKAAKQLIKGTLNEVHILKMAPLPHGHYFGARWDVVALVSESKTNMTNITDKEQFIQHAAKAFFASAWADACEEADNEEMLSGQEIMQIMPHDIDPAAIEAAKNLLDKMELQNNRTIEDMLAYIEDNDDGDREPTIEFFGHYSAMQAMGHGVGLRDAFGKCVSEVIRVPYIEFCNYSLDKDYF